MIIADEATWMNGISPSYPPIITDLLQVCSSLFPVTAVATSNVPTFPCGLGTFIMASKNKVRHYNIIVAIMAMSIVQTRLDTLADGIISYNGNVYSTNKVRHTS